MHKTPPKSKKECWDPTNRTILLGRARQCYWAEPVRLPDEASPSSSAIEDAWAIGLEVSFGIRLELIYMCCGTKANAHAENEPTIHEAHANEEKDDSEAGSQTSISTWRLKTADQRITDHANEESDDSEAGNQTSICTWRLKTNHQRIAGI